jgi:hypothetical protein
VKLNIQARRWALWKTVNSASFTWKKVGNRLLLKRTRQRGLRRIVLCRKNGREIMFMVETYIPSVHT